MKRCMYLLVSCVLYPEIACSSVSLDAGSDRDGGKAQVTPATHGTRWPGAPSNTFDEPCTTLAAPNGFGGIWEGAFDSYTLPSGSRALRVEIDGAYEQQNGLCGKVVFGTGAPPPVATDPKAAPPGAPWPLGSNDLPRLGRIPVEGFVYEFASNGTLPTTPDGGGSFNSLPAVQGDRARFAITFLQSYKSWCNLQLSYQYPGTLDPRHALTGTPPRYGCVPPDAQGGIDGGLVCPNFSGLYLHDVSCAQVTYCIAAVCTCGTVAFAGVGAAEGCTVPPPVNNPGSSNFDLTLSGDVLSGNVVLIDGVEPVHLTRVK